MATSDGTVVARPLSLARAADDSRSCSRRWRHAAVRVGDESVRSRPPRRPAGGDADAPERPSRRRPALPGRARSGELGVDQQVEVPADPVRRRRRRARGSPGRRRVPRALDRRTLLLLRNAQHGRGWATLLWCGRGVALTAQPFGPQALEVAGAGCGRTSSAAWRLDLLSAPCSSPCGLFRGTRVLATPWSGSPRRSVRRVGVLAGRLRRATNQRGPGSRRRWTSPSRGGRGRPRGAGRRHRRPSRRLRRPRVAAPTAGLGAAHSGRDPAGPGRRPDRARGQSARRREVLAWCCSGRPRLLVAAVLGEARRDRRDAAAFVHPGCSLRSAGAVFSPPPTPSTCSPDVGHSMVNGESSRWRLLPAALLLRRTACRLCTATVRSLSGLACRRVEPTSAPEHVLAEMLTTLSRSLRLDYARIGSTGRRWRTGLGPARSLRGQPIVVELEVAGAAVGRVEMEASRCQPWPRDRRRPEDVGTQVGALVQALAAGRAGSGTESRWWRCATRSGAGSGAISTTIWPRRSRPR